MASNNIFSASLSGLNAAMYEMNTTQNNIANASTPGYTRQQVTLSAQGNPVATGSGFVGQGVSVSSVVRVYDQFLTVQVQQQQSQSSYLNTYLSSATQVDNLVSNTTSGVSTAMQGVFNAVNGLANTPGSVPASQTVLSTAQTAVNSFQSMSQGLTSISTALNGQITNSVQQINTYATQIATLNSSIASANALNNGQPPNSLLDQRDQLVTQLNQQIGATTQLQPDGTMSVFIGSGQALVVGNQSMALQVVQDPANPSNVNVAYLNNGKTTAIQQTSLQSGSLGAYIAFNAQSLQPAQNALGLVALGFASNINQQNQMGQDMNGAPGAALMSVAGPLVSAGAANAGTGVVSATIANVSAMTASDYQLKYNGSSYTLTRLSDNKVTQLGSTVPLSQVVDGLTVTASAGMTTGDSFLIRPTISAAGSLAMTTTDPTKVASALPYNSVASINAKNGTMTASLGVLTTSTVNNLGTAASTDTFTVDGKTLFTNTLPAGTAGNLITPAQLDTAWTAFAAANPGYSLTGTFAGGNAQITKADGTAIVLNETMKAGAGATMTSLAATGVGFTSTTPSNLTGKIAGITVNTPTNTSLKNPVVITFTGAATYTVTGAVPAVAGVQAYTAPNISYNGWTMQMSGAPAPAAGDVFSVGANSGAATVSNGSYNLSPVSISFTSPTAYNVVEMTGTPPVAVTLGSGLIPPAVGGSSTVSYNGWTTSIAGVPATGDTFNVAQGSNAGAMVVTPGATNAGAGSISGGAFAVQPFTIMFNNPPTSYTVSGATPAVVGTVPYVAGQNISYNGWTMQVTGKPVAGDVFNVAPNTTGTGDSRNALLMAGLQSRNLMSNGTTTFQGQFGQMVGAIGAKTSELTTTSAAQTNMVAQTVAAQQSVSGVNLDQEAANLLQYQRAYQASAKAMQIANTMFDALLTLR
ncbi:MAG: flagellar hook-associated protein FlgK [Proteobacteria bacterium]|nr:flagellar hook-associated protein FlgK [Pseudomonadota bacterium]